MENDYVFLDSDNVGLSWHDYEELPDGNLRFFEDCIDQAIILSEDKYIILASCMNPIAFREMKPNNHITDTYFINLVCSDEELARRLKGRPLERMTHSDEFIKGQVDYMNWFRSNSKLMNKVVDSTNQTVEETTDIVKEHIKSLL